VTAPSDPSASWTLPRLAIDADGAWLSEGVEVTHPGILANLRSNLRQDDAGAYLQVGPVRVPVELADTPYVVVRVEMADAGATVILNDLSREALDLDTLVFGPGDIPYCRVLGGRFEARFNRGAAWELLQHVEHDPETGATDLVLPGLRRPIPAVDRPRPSRPA
jgi:hypothetical protein